ncbi:hypothetical protein [Aurantivibrio plasticivorans]
MITEGELRTLEDSVNAMLYDDNMSFKLSVHFTRDRVNDKRNDPMIKLRELQSIFNRINALHKSRIAALIHNDTFNIRCVTPHINMPCAVNKKSVNINGRHQENIVITIMRKKTWVSKDPVEFVV